MQTWRIPTAMRGVSSIMSGSAVGQGLVILCYPLLTRLYDPAEFGLLAVFTAVVGMIAIVSTATLEGAIPIPRDDRDAADVAWTALTAVAATTLLTAVAGLVAAEPVAGALGVPALARYWWLIALTVLVMGTYAVLSEWMVRQRSYGALGWRNLLQGLGQTGTQIGLGVLGVAPAGLLLGLGVGRSVALGGLMSRGGLLRTSRPKLAGLRATVRRFRRFPLLAGPSALVNQAGLEVPLLIVSALYGDARAGLLGLTIRIFSAPTALIGQAVDQVFTGEVSAALRRPQGRLGPLVRDTARRLLLVGSVPCVLLLVAGPWLFGLVFGPEWAEAGEYARFLALAYLVQFAVNPVTGTLLLLERQGQLLGWGWFRLVLTAGGPAVCGLVGAPVRFAVAALAIGHVVSYVLMYVLCARAARAFDDHDEADGERRREA